MSDTKQIKFQFVVDQGSAREVNRVLDEMIKKAQELGKSLAGVGGGQGLLGGVKAGAGGASSQSTLAGKGGSAAQKGSFTSILTSNVDVFKKMATDGGAAMKVMGDAVQRGISQQQREINGLKESLEALARTYEKVGGASAGALGEKIQGKVLQIQTKIAQGQKELAKLEALRPKGKELLPEIPYPGEEGGKKGVFGRLNDWIASKTGGGVGGAGGGAGGSATGQLLSSMGLTRGMMGGAALGAVGAWGLRNIYREINEQPDQLLGSEARQATSLSTRSLEIRRGELRNKMAEQAILQDPDKRKDYEALNSGWRRFGYSAGAFFSGNWGDMATGRAADQGVRERQLKQQEMERQADPLADTIVGEAQNYRATLSAMRAMGVSAQKGLTGFDALAKHRAAYAAFDDGEIAAAFQGIQAAGTRTAAHRLQGYAMHGTAAGIGGAAGSIGTMSKFGTRGGRAFAEEMLRMAGGGGVDASTVGGLTQYIAAQQDRLGLVTGARQGQFQGQGLMEMLAQGTQGAGGRIIAEQNMRGVDYLQRAMTGQTSGYQQARNFMIAGDAAPGLNMYGQGFLASKMSMTELADAASGKGGDVSAVFKALGGSKGAAGDYFKGVTKSLLEGVSGTALEGTDAGVLMRAMTDSGQDPREFFKKGGYSKLKGADGKPMTKEQAVAAYAGALQVSDTDMDPATAMGTARAITGVGEGPKKGKGKAGAQKSPEVELATQEMKALAVQTKHATHALEKMTQAARSNAAQAEWEAKHRAAGTTISQEDRTAVNKFFAEYPNAAPQDGDQFLEELHQKAEAAKKAANSPTLRGVGLQGIRGPK